MSGCPRCDYTGWIVMQQTLFGPRMAYPCRCRVELQQRRSEGKKRGRRKTNRNQA